MTAMFLRTPIAVAFHTAHDRDFRNLYAEDVSREILQAANFVSSRDPALGSWDMP